MKAHLALALGALFVQCSPTDVVVANLPPHHDGGPEKHCDNNSECHPNEYCARAACDLIGGECAALPAVCDFTRAPTCGCDGVTYWNDCLRQQAGITASTEGQCGFGAAGCGGSLGPCQASNASCARGAPSQTRCAKEQDPGICWVLPPTCPEGDTELYVLCDTPTVCGDACTVIRSERPFRPLGATACP